MTKVATHKITPKEVFEDVLQAPAKIFVDKFEGLKTLGKLAKGGSELAVKIFHKVGTEVPHALDKFSDVAKDFTGVLSAVELAITIQKWANGDAYSGETIWQRITKGTASGVKTFKNTLETGRFVVSFIKDFKPILQVGTHVIDVIKIIGPIISICDIVFAIFTSINEGLKIHASKQKVRKYEAKQLWISKKFEDHTISKNETDPKEKFSWEAKGSEEKVVAEMEHVSLKKLFGKDILDQDSKSVQDGLVDYQKARAEIQDSIKKRDLSDKETKDLIAGLKSADLDLLVKQIQKRKTAPSPEKIEEQVKKSLEACLVDRKDAFKDDFLNVLIHDKTLYSGNNDLNKLVEEVIDLKRLSKLDNSLVGKIETALLGLTVDDFSVKFIDEMKLLNTGKGGYVGSVFTPGLDDQALLKLVRKELRDYLLSGSESPKDVVKLILEDNKKIKKFVKEQDRLHHKWRKWENMADYTLETTEKADVKAGKLIKYYKSKQDDKVNEVKAQEKVQWKSWVTIGFAVSLFILASASLFFTFAPFTFAAVPFIIVGLALMVSVFCLAKVIFTEYVTIPKKRELDKTAWVKVA